MKVENTIVGLAITGLVGTTLLALMEAAEEIIVTPVKVTNPIKDKIVLNHGKYVTTWHQNEVKEFDEKYIEFNTDPYQIYTKSSLSKNKSLEEIMSRVSIYNRRNPVLNKNTAAEGVQI